MYYLIETEKQLDKFIQSNDVDTLYIEFIPANNRVHPALTQAIAMYVYNEVEDKGYIINISHPDCLCISTPPTKILQRYKTLLTPSKKCALHYENHSNYVDIESKLYLQNKKTQTKWEQPFIYKQMYRDYPHTQTNKLIPIGKLYEYYENKRKQVLNQFDNTFNTKSTEWYNNVLIPALNYIESQGIGFKDLDKVYDIHPTLSTKNNRFYSQYNFQTTTGRPSNKFDNVNLMALTKNSPQREWIVPQNDYLLEIDFDGYHPRIIGNAIGQPLNVEKSVHEQLGEMYFDAKELTLEQYKKSKELTFKQLYGGIFDEFKNIGFFKKTNEFIEDLYRTFHDVGYIELPISGRRFCKEEFPNIGPQKLFNYFIQMSETERNIEIIGELKKYLEGKKTKLIMYVYDAFVFDISGEDGPNTVNELEGIIGDGVFGVKSTIGMNYNEM